MGKVKPLLIEVLWPFQVEQPSSGASFGHVGRAILSPAKCRNKFPARQAHATH
jgi:hypothetical protein